MRWGGEKCGLHTPPSQNKASRGGFRWKAIKSSCTYLPPWKLLKEGKCLLAWIDGLGSLLVKDAQNKSEPSPQEFRNVVSNANKDYIVEILLECIQALPLSFESFGNS